MRRILALLIILLPLEAQALSCLRPSVARSFLGYDKAEETYIVVQGRLTFDESLLPRNSYGEVAPPQMTKVPAHLTGKSLNRSGFKVPFEQDLTLEVACFGPWCGGAKTGGEVLAFLRVDEGGYALDVNPCGGALFPEPRPDMLKTARTCLQGGRCQPD